MLRNVNDFVGIPYSDKNHKTLENGTSCSGLLYFFDEGYKQVIDDMSSLMFSKMDQKILSEYYEINLEKRMKDDIIFFKDRSKRSWEHIGILVDSDYVLHAEESKYGSKADHIDALLFRNLELKIFRKR